MKFRKIAVATLLSVVASGALLGDDSVNEIDSVTVTANKIEENIQDVPQSITVLDGEILEEKGIHSVLDVIREIPNMGAFERTGTEVNFRGLNASTFTNNNPVVIYIDGVPTNNRASFDFSMVNIERIEVLRGPQGTLYGKDAIGAVINVITKDSANIFGGTLGLEYESYNTRRGMFNLNIPISKDKLFLNLNGEVMKTDGWVENTYLKDDKAGAIEDKKFGASGKYKANDKLSIKFKVNTIKKDNGTPYSSGTKEKDLNKIERKIREKISVDVAGYEKYDIDSQGLSLDYSGDNYNLSSITTRRSTHLDGEYDGDFVSNNQNYPDSNGATQWMDQKAQEYTQEFRLSNKANADMKWVGGIYLDKRKVDNKRYGWEFANYDSNTYQATGGTSYQDAPSVTNTKTQAIFGQTIIPLSNSIELTLGARAQKITSDMDYKMYYFNKRDNVYYLSNNTATSQKTPYHTLNGEKSWNAFLPKAAMAYKIGDDTTTFASISKGYMPGGFNYFSQSGTLDDVTFKPQTSINYEIGAKGVYENLKYAVSVFRMDISDIHIYYTTNNGKVYVTDNAKKAHSQGAELDFTYFPTDSLEIGFAFGVIDAKYDDYKADNVKYDGEKIEQTPSHTANLSLAYYGQNGFYSRTDIKNAGSMNLFDNANKKLKKVDGFTSADLKVGYKIGSWNTYGYVKNITNEEHIVNFQSNSSVGGVATFSEPRKVGVGVKYTF